MFKKKKEQNGVNLTHLVPKKTFSQLRRAVCHPVKDVKHVEGTIHNSHFSCCGRIIQRNAALFSSAFPLKKFSPSVLSQSVSQALFWGFFFSFLFIAAIPPPQKNDVFQRVVYAA